MFGCPVLFSGRCEANSYNDNSSVKYQPIIAYLPFNWSFSGIEPFWHKYWLFFIDMRSIFRLIRDAPGCFSLTTHDVVLDLQPLYIAPDIKCLSVSFVDNWLANWTHCLVERSLYDADNPFCLGMFLSYNLLMFCFFFLQRCKNPIINVLAPFAHEGHTSFCQKNLRLRITPLIITCFIFYFFCTLYDTKKNHYE